MTVANRAFGPRFLNCDREREERDRDRDRERQRGRKRDRDRLRFCDKRSWCTSVITIRTTNEHILAENENKKSPK